MKKILSLLLVMCMLFANVSVMAYSDVEERTYDSKVVTTLTSLNVLDGFTDGSFKPNDTVTRGQMAKIVCRLLGYGELSPKATDFVDVTENHWASGYVSMAQGLGAINGYGDGTFGPDDEVTYEQVVKMIVCALGYQTKAAEEGTYPSGHLFVARTTGITENVSGNVGEPASRMTVAKLLYNSLDVPLMQKVVSGTSASFYGVFDGEEFKPKKTVLSEYLDAVKIEGVVENNSISLESLREDQIQIKIYDNYGSRVTAVNSVYDKNATITCYVGDTNAKEFLGKKVEAYLTYETSSNDDPTVLAIFDSVNENKKLTIEFNDIKSVEETAKAYIVKYWTDKENNKFTTIYVSKDTVYYVNGQNVSDFKLTDPVNGYCTIDFSLNGKVTGDYDYDYAFVSIYENFVVDSVDEIAEKVYAIDNSPSYLASIDFSEDADYELVLKDVKGNDVDVTDLAEYDVVTMKVNPYNWNSTRPIQAIDAVLVQDSIDGVITEVYSGDSEEIGDEEYYVDGVAYDIDPAFATTFALDDAGTFYLDANKNIVAFDQTSGKNNNYGVIVKAADTAGVDTRYQIKMFTTDGNMGIYDLADKVKVTTYADGKTSSTSEKDEDAYALISAPAVVAYKLNAAGDISALSFADTDVEAATTASAKSAAIITNAYNEVGRIDAENKETKVIKAGSTFYMDADTKVIILDSAKIGDIEEEDFAVYSEADFTADQDFANISVYDADTNRYAGLVFITDAEITLDTENIGVAMVKSVNAVNNADGDPTSKISAINAKGNVSYVYDDETTVTADDAGELFIPKSFNDDNEIKTVLQVTEYVDGEFVLTTAFENYYQTLVDKKSDTTYYFGKVDFKKGNQITFNDILNGEDEQTILVKNSVPVMVYDESKSTSYKVTYETAGYMSFATKLVNGKYPISANEIASYYVFAREYKGQIVDVVYYCYTSDVTLETTPEVELEGIVVDVIVNKEEVIAE